MVKLFRYIATLALLVWLGSVITLTFIVAPSLFGNESGRVPNSTVAADIIAPLLHKMVLTGWISIPVAMAATAGAWKFSGKRKAKSFAATCLLLALAWCGSFYSGTVLTSEMRGIRDQFKQEMGGYHNAPKDHPERARFSKLHGASMMIALGDLLAGLGALYLVTQVVGSGGATTASARAPGGAAADYD